MQLFRVFIPVLVSVCLLFGCLPAMAAPVAVLPGLQGVFTGTPPADIGIQTNQLIACPASPNCVSTSSNSDDAEHYISPMEYTAAPDAVRDKLVAILQNQPRTQIIEQTDNYILVEFTSHLMGVCGRC